MSLIQRSCDASNAPVPEFEKRWNRDARQVGTSWRVDEASITVRGRWAYLSRAVDKHGLTVDFLLSEDRDMAAAKRFLIRAPERHGAPDRITLDGSPATDSAVAEVRKSEALRPQTKLRTSKYLNNIIEQDHRSVKQGFYPMLGFKNFAHATTTISGIELALKIKQSQFDVEKLTGGVKERVPQMWVAVLAA